NTPEAFYLNRRYAKQGFDRSVSSGRTGRPRRSHQTLRVTYGLPRDWSGQATGRFIRRSTASPLAGLAARRASGGVRALFMHAAPSAVYAIVTINPERYHVSDSRNHVLQGGQGASDGREVHRHVQARREVGHAWHARHDRFQRRALLDGRGGDGGSGPRRIREDDVRATGVIG